MPRGRKPPIPLSLVVGPTGAGKTTLINRLLADPAFAHTAVILNDFGTTALTAAVVDRAEDDILALGSGCVCCSVRGALTDGLERLLRAVDNGRIQKIGRVLIEAAEAADPAAVAAAVLAHPYLSLRFAFDGIVAVLGSDAAEALATRADVVRQVAIADVVALAGSPAIAIPNATALLVDAANAPPGVFTGHGPFAPETGDPATWLGASNPARCAGLAGEAARVRCFRVARDATMPIADLERFLEYLVTLRGPSLIRLRAVVGTGSADVVVAESYGAFFLPSALIGGGEGAGAPHGLRFDLVARDFDEAAFSAYLDAFLGEPRVDMPDRQALTANPLTIAGFSARRGR